MLKLLVNLFSRQISTPAFQNVRLKMEQMLKKIYSRKSKSRGFFQHKLSTNTREGMENETNINTSYKSQVPKNPRIEKCFNI